MGYFFREELRIGVRWGRFGENIRQIFIILKIFIVGKVSSLLKFIYDVFGLEFIVIIGIDFKVKKNYSRRN